MKREDLGVKSSRFTQATCCGLSFIGTGQKTVEHQVNGAINKFICIVADEGIAEIRY